MAFSFPLLSFFVFSMSCGIGGFFFLPDRKEIDILTHPPFFFSLFFFLISILRGNGGRIPFPRYAQREVFVPSSSRPFPNGQVRLFFPETPLKREGYEVFFPLLLSAPSRLRGFTSFSFPFFSPLVRPTILTKGRTVVGFSPPLFPLASTFSQDQRPFSPLSLPVQGLPTANRVSHRGTTHSFFFSTAFSPLFCRAGESHFFPSASEGFSWSSTTSGDVAGFFLPPPPFLFCTARPGN